MALRYSSSAKLAFQHRLGDSWQELATVLDLKSHDQRPFVQGREANDLWRWAEVRGRLSELPGKLREIGRGDLADILDAGSEEGPEDGPGRRVSPMIKLSVVITLSLAIAGAVIVGVTVWSGSGRKAGNGPTGGPATDPPGTGASGPAPTGTPVAVKIARTWDVDTNSYVGVLVYSDPSLNGKDTNVGHYAEGQTISIVCQDRHGRTITDAPWRDRQLSSPVWDRLAGQNEVWVPDMYVDTPKVSGGTPPDHLPACS